MEGGDKNPEVDREDKRQIITLPQQASDLAWCCLWTGISFGCEDEWDVLVPSAPQILVDLPFVLLGLLGLNPQLAPLLSCLCHSDLPGVLQGAGVLTQTCHCLL